MREILWNLRVEPRGVFQNRADRIVRSSISIGLHPTALAADGDSAPRACVAGAAVSILFPLTRGVVDAIFRPGVVAGLGGFRAIGRTNRIEGQRRRTGQQAGFIESKI